MWRLALLLLCCTACAARPLADSAADSDPFAAQVTDTLWMEVTRGEEVLGRVEIGLFGTVVPKTAHNWKGLCTGAKGYGYTGSQFHRVIKAFMIQGGDFTTADGLGGRSVYGGAFADESFQLKHTGPGLLSMANSGPDTNGAQFFCTTVATPHLDGHHVVFGRVLSGMDVVTAVEQGATGPGDRPVVKTFISSCTLAGGAEGNGEADPWEQRVYGA